MNSQASSSQKKNILFTVFSIIAVMSMFVGLLFFKITTPRILSQEELRQKGILIFDQPRLIKPFSLIDKNGQEISKAELENKVSLLFFGFTFCPDICPTTLSELSRIYTQLSSEAQQEIRVIMVSLDPARDTPERLKPYVEYFDPNFSALTGEFPEIAGLSSNVNIAFKKVFLDEGYTIDHSGQVVILNRHGDYAGYIRTPLDTDTLPKIIQSTILKLVD